MKNKIKFALAFMPIIAFANIETKNIINSASNGREVVIENKLQAIEQKKNNDSIYRNEIILNWIYNLNLDNPRRAEVVAKTSLDSMIKNVSEQENNATEANNSNKELVSVKGFCYIPNEINVGKQPSSLRVECQTNAGAITMFANLVNVNEKASLIVDPRYIEKNNYRYMVDSSIVTNEDKTSYNIATYVNDRKIAEIGWGALSVSSDEVKNSTNAYLKALEDSKKKQDVEYITTTDGAGNSYMSPVQTTNTEKPDPLDYLITAGVNIVSSTIKSTAEIFKKDLPYLYQIVGKTKIWIDLQVNKKGEYVK
ncbi:hypothetical protein [Campylobacter vicugnae]|uniref:hypothetical protein n=1 Tax=Campylobacter vicugnae TaxID=1660076 RepID=UPI000A32F5AE|nr:hypothetical protein [Campylobacter sp. S0112]